MKQVKSELYQNAHKALEVHWWYKTVPCLENNVCQVTSITNNVFLHWESRLDISVYNSGCEITATSSLILVFGFSMIAGYVAVSVDTF